MKRRDFLRLGASAIVAPAVPAQAVVPKPVEVDVRLQLVSTYALDRWAGLYALQRKIGEGDDSLRRRIIAEIRSRS